MFRRGFVLLALGCSLGLLFATWLQPTPVQGGEAPPELLRDPARPRSIAAAGIETSRGWTWAQGLPTWGHLLDEVGALGAVRS